MAKKQFDITALQNDLERSSFFTPQQSPVEQISEPAEEQQPKPQPSKTERVTRTVEPNDRTVEHQESVLDAITQGVKTDHRSTMRYSFEIYTDQIPQIEELQYLYKKRTGQKLSASRILREALEAYLTSAFEAIKRKK